MLKGMFLKSADANPSKNGEGFTLIEIVVVIFGFSLIIWGLVGLISNVFSTSTQQGSLLSDSNQARKLSFQIANELRNGQTGANGAYVLDTAGAQQIIFYSNLTGGASALRVRYFAQNGQLWKGVTQFNGSAYNTSTESTVLVQNNLANASGTLFSYYDGSYTGSSSQVSLAQPVNVTSVKFVRTSLQIYNKAGVKNTNTYTVTAGAAIRNLKSNLGQ